MSKPYKLLRLYNKFLFNRNIKKYNKMLCRLTQSTQGIVFPLIASNPNLWVLLDQDNLPSESLKSGPSGRNKGLVPKEPFYRVSTTRRRRSGDGKKRRPGERSSHRVITSLCLRAISAQQGPASSFSHRDRPDTEDRISDRI